MSDILDKITSGINKGVAKVGANSKAMLDKAKINTVIGNLEKEKSQLAQLLGLRVYDMYKTGGALMADESVVSFVSEIDSRAQLIAAQQEQLRQIEAEVNLVAGGARPLTRGGATCACGNLNAEGVKFCAKCGSPQQAASVEVPTTGPVIPVEEPGHAPVEDGALCACGIANPEGTKFCYACGSPQQAAPVEAPAGPVIPVEEPGHAPVEDDVLCACGIANPEGAKFCYGCGGALPGRPEPGIADAVPSGLCGCGQVNPEGMNFCINCGGRL